ncbi:molybdate ABC transporter substrate-binding protein [Roseiconus nitratireducens]|nr:molybdate ABC transporter substrate-binding protein [Roseiconus nitratireducens]
MHRFCTVLLAILCLLSNGCDRSLHTTAPAPTTAPLNLAVSANLQLAMQDMEARFERQCPDIDLRITYGASGSFFAQCCQGAPFDVFVSADTRYPRELVRRRLASETSFVVYAQGRLMLWTPPVESGRVGEHAAGDRGLERLVGDAFGRIAIANPRLAPYGRAAEEALKAAGVHPQVKDKLVIGESVTQAAHFAATGSADAALIARSLLETPALARGNHWQVPESLHAPILQAAVVLDRCRCRPAAARFCDFLTGTVGQSILMRHGYSLPNDAS